MDRPEATPAERLSRDELDTLVEGCLVIGPDLRCLYVNDAFARQERATPDQLLARTLLEVRPGIEGTALLANVRRCLDTRELLVLEERVDLPEGPTSWRELRFVPVPEGVAILSRDMTDRKRSEAAARHAARALAVLSECNQTLVRAEDEVSFMQDVCRIAVRSGGYAMAWIGMKAGDGERSVRPVAHAGLDEGYTQRAEVSWGDTERGAGPTGRAIRTGRTAVARFIATDEEYVPWRKDALERGFASCLAVPILDHGACIGALTIYSAEPDAFDERESELLGEMALDLGHGIAALRTRVARHKAEARVVHLNAVLRGLRSVNQLITKEKEPNRLLQAACDRLVESMGYRMAWIAVRTDGDGLRLSAQAGLSPDRAESLREQLARGLVPDCARTAFERRQVVAWRAPRVECGGCSVEAAVAPCGVLAATMENAGVVHGIVTAAVPPEYVLDEEEQGLFLELAGDLGFALYRIGLEAQHEQDEQQILSLARFPAENPNPVLRMDPEGRLLYANPASRPLLDEWGLGGDGALPETVRSWLAVASREGRLVQVEAEAAGRVFLCSVTPIAGQDYVNVYGRDITERKQAEDARARSLERQVRLNHLQRALLAPGDLSLKLKMITDSVVDIFGADFCRVWRIGPGDLCERGCMHASAGSPEHACLRRDRCLHLISSSGRYTHTNGAAHGRIPFGVYKIGQVASSEEHGFLTNDVQHDPRVHDREWARAIGLVSFAGYQLRPPGGDHLGVLALFSKQPISPDEDAQLEALSSTAAQVISAARTEEAVRESERRYRTLVENVGLGVVLVGRDYRIRMANAALTRLLGRPASELVGKECFREFERCEQVCQHCPGKLAMETGLPAETEVAGVRSDGSTQVVRVQAFRLLDDAGQTSGFIEVIEDITERKRMETALREADLFSRQVIQGVREGVVVYDRDLKIKLWNPHMERLFRVSATSVIGRHPREVLLFLREPRLIERLTVALGGETPEMLDFQFDVRGESRTGWASDVSAPLRNSAGEIAGVISVVRDITERKVLETQLLQSQKMEGIGRLAGGVAHDFNNLLSVIHGYTGFALQGLRQGDPLRDDLEQVLKAGERAAALTRQLLAFSRSQVLQPVPLELNHILADMEKMLHRIIGEDINLTQVPAPDLGLVKADPGQIEQVILNLAVNARDAMPRGGDLTIATSNVEIDANQTARHEGLEPGDYILLAITDTGCGMDAQTQQRIFEPFFTTKEKGKGTGLGLSTVYGIVKQSGGTISVRSTPGQGTTFEVLLPRAKPGAEVASSGISPRARAGGTETILVVEDDDAVRTLARRMLAASGYTVLTAATGGEALLICEAHAGQIQLVLTDVVMPQMSGKELVERLTKLCPNLRVLYMSGYTDNAIVHHGVLDPATRLIAKPFGAVDLARQVREALDEGRDR